MLSSTVQAMAIDCPVFRLDRSYRILLKRAATTNGFNCLYVLSNIVRVDNAQYTGKLQGKLGCAGDYDITFNEGCGALTIALPMPIGTSNGDILEEFRCNGLLNRKGKTHGWCEAAYVTADGSNITDKGTFKASVVKDCFWRGIPLCSN